MWTKLTFVLLFGFLTSPIIVSGVVTGEIYSIDSFVKEPIESLETGGENSVVITPFSRYLAGQRFVARQNNGYFNLFLEVQPWDWVNYIVESSKTVNIRDKTPRALSVVNADGIRQVIQADYSGGNEQQWYIVPTGADSETGLITNLLHRLCISNNGSGNRVTLETCNLNDPNQIFRLTIRTQGRCF